MPKFEKTAGFWRDRNLCHVRQPHCPRKFFSTLENLLSRDIVSICFYSHILMKSAVREGIQDMVRSLSLLPVSATLKTEIYVPASQAADCLEFLAMFWKCSNTFQRPSLSKWGKVHNLSCENEFYLHCWSPTLVLKQRPGELGNGLSSLLPLLVFKFLVVSADPSEFAVFF